VMHMMKLWRALNLFVHLGLCLLIMWTRHGSFPTRRNLLKLGKIRSCIWATLPQIGILV